jgi:nuclear pore complex protein Nup188
MGQDPIYGELAIMFLLSLSTVRPVAEQMALEGVLTQLSAANLSNYFRKPGGKGPFDEPQRMFVIWTEGFLPLCLNLLDSVGPPIAAEVATFLNSFREQLQRAEKSLLNETPGPRNPRAGTVTLGLVTEANSLSMITVILNSDTARAAADGINAADIPALEYDFESVKGLAESLVRSKRSLAPRIAFVGPLEERWSKTSVPGASDNLLMEKVVKELTGMLACFGEGSE